MTTLLTPEEKAELRGFWAGDSKGDSKTGRRILALLDEIDALRQRLKVPCAGCPGCGTGDCPDAVDALDALRADKERMDYLDQEWYREECWRDAGMPSAAPFSLFRQNMPITREAIDEARRRWEK